MGRNFISFRFSSKKEEMQARMATSCAVFTSLGFMKRLCLQMLRLSWSFRFPEGDFGTQL